jgi:hypothetical protein
MGISSLTPYRNPEGIPYYSQNHGRQKAKPPYSIISQIKIEINGITEFKPSQNNYNVLIYLSC